MIMAPITESASQPFHPLKKDMLSFVSKSIVDTRFILLLSTAELFFHNLVVSKMFFLVPLICRRIKFAQLGSF